MKEIKETCYKGTRILVGNEKREIINSMIDVLTKEFSIFNEIQIPIIQLQEIFANKVGEENNNMMYTLKDRGNRDLCLAPEYTAVIQKLANTQYKFQKDVCLFYVGECFRGEKPQAGRFRQFGVEIINPSNDYLQNGFNIQMLAMKLINCVGKKLWDIGKIQTIIEFEEMFQINNEVTRGLDYYKDGKGFEISCDKLGSSKQVCGGGEYEGGVGFAIGLDRLMELFNII